MIEEKKKDLTSDHIWALGSIVSFQSHPFFAEGDTDIILSGEVKFLPPLMVIGECLIPNGNDSNSKFPQYKCFWFSQHSCDFEEAWIVQPLLKLIKEWPDETIDIDYKSLGKTVALKTLGIELGKKKSSLKENSNDQNSNITITAHLPFVSPLLHVIGTGTVKQKPGNRTSNNSSTRFVSNLLIKCKYYNPKNDKLSDVFLPGEILQEVEQTSQETINLFKNFIRNGEYLRVENNQGEQTIVRPKRITFRAGYYFLSCYDYLQERQCDINICDKDLSISSCKLFSYELPSFKVTSNSRDVTFINATNLNKLNKEFYWRIKYKNLNDVLTERTICKMNILEFEESTATDKNEKIGYLSAFCLLKKAERTFRIDRIQKVQVLQIKQNKIA